MSWINSKKRTYTLLVAIFLVTFAVGTLAGSPIKKLFTDSIPDTVDKGKPVNILFMGIDDRENKNNSRSDTMIVASLDPSTQKMVMVSIPRDTRIKTTLGRSEKINSVNYIKGADAACKVVSNLLNVPINYYVVTNFAGFGKIVDTLGGVDLDVETNMVHKDVSYSINLKKGHQHLNGDQALQYVRYRDPNTADIGRTQRQQKFLKALAKQMFQAKTILTLPELIPEISKQVKTNIPANDMLYLAKLAKDIDTSTINAQTLPGYPYTDPSSGASYWEPDREKASIIIATLMEGKNFAVIGDPPAWLAKAPAKYESKELPNVQVLQEQNELSTTEPDEETETQSPDASGTGDSTAGTEPVTPPENQIDDLGEINGGTGGDNQEPLPPAQPGDSTDTQTPPEQGDTGEPTGGQ